MSGKPLLNPCALVRLIASDPNAVACLRSLLALGDAQGPAAARPFMTTVEAADYLRCSTGRIHDLTRLGRLTRHKEGARVLLLREEVEALVTEP